MTSRGIRLRKALGASLESPIWPQGVHPIPFDSVRHASAVHRLLTAAYQDGGGVVPGFAEWWGQLRSDDEYDPELVFVAVDRKERLVGVAHCWTSGFVKDLAVDPACRRHGLGTTLLRHAFRVFWERGADTVDLKVEVGNPSGAERLYRELGMKTVDRL